MKKRRRAMAKTKRSQQIRLQAVPVDLQTGYGGECGLTFQLQNGRSTISTPFEPVNHQGSIPRVHKPDFADASTLVGGKLHGLVVTGGAGRKDFRDPVGRASHTALIKLGTVTHEEDIRLHYGVNILIPFVYLRQADVIRGYLNAPCPTFECATELIKDFTNHFLMEVRRRGRLPDIGGAIDELRSIDVRPCQVAGVSVMMYVALDECHLRTHCADQASRDGDVIFRRSHSERNYFSEFETNFQSGQYVQHSTQL